MKQPPLPLKIFILFSGGASLIKWLINNDPAYGKKYIFIGAFTNIKDASGIEFLRQHNIPVSSNGYKGFCKNCHLVESEPKSQFIYFHTIGDRIKSDYNPDLILCSGFMRILPKVFLDMFPNRVLNVHPADLSVKDAETGKRIFTGSDAVEKAYTAGVRHMRSTIHFVTEEVDGGPICFVSPPHETDYKLSPSENQNIMKDVCDGPAGQEALRFFYTGKIMLGDTKRR